MQFGIALPNFKFGADPSPDHLLRTCRAAEASGYTSAFTSDHVLVAADDERYGLLYETVVTLAWLAGRTETIRLGTSILVLPMRNAVLAAKQLATLDVLAGGRLIVGVGVGWNEEEYRSLGAPFERRGHCLDESIAVLHDLWSEPVASFDGEFYSYRDRRCDPKPVQSGGPPIWVGGNSEIALKRAGRLGDAWHGDEVMPAELGDAQRTLAKAAADAGRPAPATTVRFTVDLYEATATARRTPVVEGHYMGAGAEIGMRGSYARMSDLVGSFREMGVTDFICQFEHETTEQHIEFIHAFASEVMSGGHRS